MKKLFFGAMFLALIIAVPIPTMARVGVNVNIGLPPPIGFSAPPALIVLPKTYVYVVPDTDVDIFFYNGWWWRLWEGRWYRSRHYDSSWAYYRSVPSFYSGIPSGWRNDYRDHRWEGRQWDYQPISHEQVQRNWSTWEKTRHWEKQNTWGVQGLQPQTRSAQPSRVVQPKSQAKPQVREATKQQQSRPKSEVKPQVREAAKQQKSRPQSGKVQPQHREAPQQSKSQHEKPERGEEEKHIRK